MPGRFQGETSDDLVLMISTGDNPRVKSYCIGVIIVEVLIFHLYYNRVVYLLIQSIYPV